MQTNLWSIVLFVVNFCGYAVELSASTIQYNIVQYSGPYSTVQYMSCICIGDSDNMSLLTPTFHSHLLLRSVNEGDRIETLTQCAEWWSQYAVGCFFLGNRI